jgi:hypothetical protein
MSRAWATGIARKNWQQDIERLLRVTEQGQSIEESCLLTVAVLGFFIAGLLVSCASSASIPWELNASRQRPAFSSHLLAQRDDLLLVEVCEP